MNTSFITITTTVLLQYYIYTIETSLIREVFIISSVLCIIHSGFITRSLPCRKCAVSVRDAGVSMWREVGLRIRAIGGMRGSLHAWDGAERRGCWGTW